MSQADISTDYATAKFSLTADIIGLVYKPSTVAYELTEELAHLKVGVNAGVSGTGRMECKLSDPTFETCISKDELQSLVRSRREYINRGGFARIYPSADRGKYAALAEHVHKRIEEDHIKFSNHDLAAAMKAGRDSEMPDAGDIEANADERNSNRFVAGGAAKDDADEQLTAEGALQQVLAERIAQAAFDKYHAEEDAADGHGTTWELHNVAADLEQIWVGRSEQDRLV